jgi:alpha-tubulin suppressor-like RCC1 family protein
MTSINVGNLVLTLQEKINSSINENEIHYYANAIKQLKSGLVYTVETINDLPNVSESEGYLYFVRQDELIYIPRFSGWTPLYEKDFELIFSWGAGSSGQLGDGTIVDKCSPVREISYSTNWYQISAGADHSTALKTTGEIWSWGRGLCGQLGDGSTVNKCSPVREISSSTNWCQVSAGYDHTSALKTTGEIWSWGAGSSGRLGDGATTNRCSPVREISSSTDWCQVSAGFLHSSAIKTTGEIWSWGDGFCGILGDGTTVSKFSPVREISSSTDWCQVSAGGFHSSAIKYTGEIWSWGRGYRGVLGNGATTDRCSPVREISSSTDWCQVSAGYAHSSALKTNGEIWSWGRGLCGRLGNNSTADSCSPVREISSSTNWCQVDIGTNHSSAVKTTGEIWSWGSNICGRLGDGTTVAKCSPVREISSSTDWCQVSSGDAQSSAIKIFSL